VDDGQRTILEAERRGFIRGLRAAARADRRKAKRMEEKAKRARDAGIASHLETWADALRDQSGEHDRRASALECAK
jgi:hypothetical protein